MLPHSHSNVYFSPYASLNPRVDFVATHQPQQDHHRNKDRGSNISSSNWGDVVGNAHVLGATHVVEHGPAIHSAPSPEDPDASASELSRPSKRRTTEKSRSAMSYPRKRAVTACQLCRQRKTKCSNTRPKCKLCADAGADCVYGDPLDHSS